MKRIASILWKSLLPAMLLAACTTSVTENIDSATQNGDRAIGFATPAVRSVIDDADDTDFTAFDVWGWYAPTGETGNPAQLFGTDEGGEVVSRAGGPWSYEGQRYWQNGQTYHFYALYPSDLSGANYDSDGTLTIKNYDTKDQGTTADLMAASSTREYNGTNSEAVAFSFSHLLSRVTISIKTVGVEVTATDAKLYGLYTTGSYSGSSDNGTWTTTGNVSGQNSPSFTNSTELTVETNATGYLWKDLLLIPQNVHKLTLDISLQRENENTPTTYTLNLDSSVAEWRPGQHYNYVLTVSVDAITFSNFTVDQWGVTHTGGDINVGPGSDN